MFIQLLLVMGIVCFAVYPTSFVGSEDKHLVVRSLLVEYKKINPHYFEPLLMSRNEPTISAHLNKMSRPCSWGTHIEILAAATLFEVPVYEYVQSLECSENHWEVHHPLVSAHKLSQLPITELHQVHHPPYC